jgi:phosphomannomutase
MKAFHAYDIRGIYNKDFNKDDAYKVGFFLPGLLNTNRILVGRDVRESSDEIFSALSQGINDAGADVYNIGISTTPMVYYATAKFGFEASVMITASHNSKEYNGMKISKKNALPVGYDTGLNLLENLVNTKSVEPVMSRGSIIEYSIYLDYIEFLRQYKTQFPNLNLAIDCSNGMAALLIKELLGDSPIYINDQLDGTFPSHEPNPLVAKNIVQLQNIVKEHTCDIGVIFDGDADRVMFVDENSKFISPDLMIGLLAHYFLEQKKQTGAVLIDIRTSKAVAEYIRQFGGEVHTWRVGRAFAAYKLREIDGIFGGELAGHYYFRDFYYSDSGIMACLIMLEILDNFKKNGVKVSEVISRIERYSNSGEINFRISKKREAMEAVREHFTLQQLPTAFFDFDGYRLEYQEWWFNIRPSNTEPYLRLIVEALSKELLDQKLKEIKAIIESFE